MLRPGRRGAARQGGSVCASQGFCRTTNAGRRMSVTSGLALLHLSRMHRSSIRDAHRSSSSRRRVETEFHWLVIPRAAGQGRPNIPVSHATTHKRLRPPAADIVGAPATAFLYESKPPAGEKWYSCILSYFTNVERKALIFSLFIPCWFTHSCSNGLSIHSPLIYHPDSGFCFLSVVQSIINGRSSITLHAERSRSPRCSLASLAESRWCSHYVSPPFYSRQAPSIGTHLQQIL